MLRPAGSTSRVRSHYLELNLPVSEQRKDSKRAASPLRYFLCRLTADDGTQEYEWFPCVDSQIVCAGNRESLLFHLR